MDNFYFYLYRLG